MFITYVFRPANLLRFFFVQMGSWKQITTILFPAVFRVFVGFHPFLRGSNRAWGHVFRHMVPPKIPMAGLPGHVTFPCRHQADLDQKHQAGGEVELHFWDASRGEPLVEWGSFLPGGPCGVHGKVAGVPSCWVFLTRTFFRAQKRIRTNHCESGDVSWQETWRRPKRPPLINPQWTLASTRDTGKGWNGIIRHPPSAPGSVVFQAFHHLRGQRKYPLVI